MLMDRMRSTPILPITIGTMLKHNGPNFGVGTFEQGLKVNINCIVHCSEALLVGTASHPCGRSYYTIKKKNGHTQSINLLPVKIEN